MADTVKTLSDLLTALSPTGTGMISCQDLRDMIVSIGPAYRDVTFLLALGTPATTGANKTNAIPLAYAGTIVKAKIVAKTGPTGADLIVDINLDGTTVSAKKCKNEAGDGETGDAITVNIDCPADRDPFIFTGDTFLAFLDANGDWYAVGYASDKKGTFKGWQGTLDNIPSHWCLCDGSNGSPDFRGFYLVGVDAAGSGHTPVHTDEGTIGARVGGDDLEIDSSWVAGVEPYNPGSGATFDDASPPTIHTAGAGYRVNDLVHIVGTNMILRIDTIGGISGTGITAYTKMSGDYDTITGTNVASEGANGKLVVESIHNNPGTYTKDNLPDSEWTGTAPDGVKVKSVDKRPRSKVAAFIYRWE